MRALLRFVQGAVRATLIAFMVLATSCVAAAPLDCTPKTLLTPGGDGVGLAHVITPDGAAYATWCRVPAAECIAAFGSIPSGQECWAPRAWAGLYRLAPASLSAIVGSLYAAPPGGVVGAVNAAIKAGEVRAEPGTKAACQQGELLRAACVKLRTDGCAGLPGCVPTPERCGTPRDCSVVPETPPPAQRWVVSRVGMASTASTRPAYPISGGVRGTTSVARATIGADCDCTVKSVEGTSTYCAHESTKSTVTLCQPAK